ncbi:MAG: GNAT family N-acetyltransferase [Candidatus Dormibacteraeota bacterium]|nr:GNAT family N-acetyltransferase [Candidatus Dormibacteraeota bacterium]
MGDPRTPAAHVRSAHLRDLSPVELHGILRLRSDVFVVEQQCAYADIDGRDADPGTEHLWVEEDGAVVATLRIVRGDVAQIGRIVTRADRRGAGLASVLLRAALDRVSRPVELKAQARLDGWYERFGFVRCSEEWIEDGIPHVRMRLTR